MRQRKMYLRPVREEELKQWLLEHCHVGILFNNDLADALAKALLAKYEILTYSAKAV
jgi:hypothetical protein